MALKPDLVALKKGILLLVECKPVHNDQDVDKLRRLLGDARRLDALGGELDSRGLLARTGHTLTSLPLSVRGAVAHAGTVVPMPDLATLHMADAGRIVEPMAPDSLFVAAIRSSR